MCTSASNRCTLCSPSTCPSSNLHWQPWHNSHRFCITAQEDLGVTISCEDAANFVDETRLKKNGSPYKQDKVKDWDNAAKRFLYRRNLVSVAKKLALQTGEQLPNGRLHLPAVDESVRGVRPALSQAALYGTHCRFEGEDSRETKVFSWGGKRNDILHERMQHLGLRPRTISPHFETRWISLRTPLQYLPNRRLISRV